MFSEQILSYTSKSLSSRAFCSNCEFIVSRCLCQYLKPIHNNTKLIVLQHPSETKHALNTVRIMQKTFTNISIYIGENFSENEEINEILNNPKHRVVLVYPDTKSTELTKEAVNELPTHLILIDGSWRKAKKLYLLSKNLHQLQTVKLNTQLDESKYKIRSSTLKYSLSTLEAAVKSLNLLEPKLSCDSAVNAFEKMIDYQIEKMGPEIYKTNYSDKKKSSH